MLMRPDARTNQSFLYCLAVAAERYDVDVFFTVAMSNHHHTGIHDRHGNFPAFLEYFHKLFAKCQNAHRGRWENFWASEQTSAVRLVSPDDVLDKMAYSLCNPVEAGLVERANEWPGVSSLAAMVTNQPMSAKRPEHFFRPEGSMPESASLAFARPPGFEGLDETSWRNLVQKRVADKEENLGRRHKKAGRRIMGVRRVLKQPWSSRPKSSEPRRNLSPRLAAKNKWRRIEALFQNRAFLKAYAVARSALKAGSSGVVFPAGTYWLSRFTHVACEAPPV